MEHRHESQSGSAERRLAEPRQAWRRLRWRLRGAWQWPTFAALTVLDSVVLAVLPFYEAGPGGLVPALLLAGFANLFAVALGAPPAGRMLRARRPDLPRAVARDYAGTTLLVALAALFVAGGLAHRPAVEQAVAERQAVVAGVDRYVASEAPQLRAHVAATDVRQLESQYYRACVPRAQPERWLCLFVSTDQRPVGLVRDPSEVSNERDRMGGGLR
jgi:hypothetical protein